MALNKAVVRRGIRYHRLGATIGDRWNEQTGEKENWLQKTIREEPKETPDKETSSLLDAIGSSNDDEENDDI